MIRALTLALALGAAPLHLAAQSAGGPPNPARPAVQAARTTADSARAAGAARTIPPPSLANARADTGAVAVPAPSARALSYYRSGSLLWVVDTLWSLLVPLLVLFTGLSARIRDLAWRLGRRWYFALVIYGALITLLFALLDLPLAWYEGFVREHAYGLSTQTAAKWWGDTAKQLLIAIITFALVMWVPYLLLRKSPRRWWLWSSLAALPLLVASFYLQPLVVDPLFNKFGPMHDKQLEAHILAEASRAGIEGSRVFEVNKSVDTRALNAYVTGVGGSKRIVIWDTTLRRLDERELLFVVGHEMGHYVLHHVPLLLGTAVLLLLLFLYVTHRSAGWLIARWRARFGFDLLDDFASYPLLGVIVSVVSLLVLPLFLALSRQLEHEADRFGLELTRDDHAAATAFVKLQSDNLAVPRHSTLYKLWHDSHPPMGERIDFANQYHPWREGKPLRYGGHFR